MNKYTIKQFAENLGVSQDLIRYYREKGIITPEKDENNNYNYYSFRQTRLIYEAIKYRNLGFSNKEIIDILHHDSVSEIQQKLDDKQKKLIEKKEEIDYHICYLNHINQFLSMKHKEWYIIKTETMYFLPHTSKNNNFIIDNGELLKKWSNNFPITEHATLFETQYNEDSSINHIHIGHGFICTLSNLKKFNIPLFDNIIEIQESRSILISLKRMIIPDSYYYENNYLSISYEDNIRETINEIVNNNHFKITGKISLIFKGYDRQEDTLYQHFMLLVPIE